MWVDQFAMKGHHVWVAVRYWMQELGSVIERNLILVLFQYALHVGIFKLMELD